jgi:TonB family protein
VVRLGAARLGHQWCNVGRGRFGDPALHVFGDKPLAFTLEHISIMEIVKRIVRLLAIGSAAIGMVLAQAKPKAANGNDAIYASNVKLTYSCEPFKLDYTIQNDNAFQIDEVNVEYWVHYTDAFGKRSKRGHISAYTNSLGGDPGLAAHSSIHDTEFIFSGNEKIDSCLAKITEFKREVEKTAAQPVSVQVGNKLKVSPDCADDYTKLLEMKPGLEKRKYAAQLVLLGCVTYKPVYANKIKSFKYTDWQTVPGLKNLEFAELERKEAEEKILVAEQQKAAAEQQKRLDEEDLTGIFKMGEAGVSAPVLRFKVEPEYSEAARAAKYQGTVLLYVEVDPSGKAKNIRVLHSLGLGLDEKAMEAVRKWSFTPGRKNGRPVTVAAQIDINFRLL